MSLEEAKKKAIALLDKRDFSKGELVEKLVEKGIERTDAEAAAERYAELGYIDDERYAAMVVRHYAAKGFGASRVREELRRRRVPRELWDEALETMPQGSETIDAVLRSKIRGTGDKDDIRRAAEALMRRGFSWDEVREAVERYNIEVGSI